MERVPVSFLPTRSTGHSRVTQRAKVRVTQRAKVRVTQRAKVRVTQRAKVLSTQSVGLDSLLRKGRVQIPQWNKKLRFGLSPAELSSCSKNIFQDK